MVPDTESARAAKQKTFRSWAAQASWGGFISAKSSRASLRAAVLDLVDRIPDRFLCMCPFGVAVLGGKCLSNPFSKPGKERN